LDHICDLTLDAVVHRTGSVGAPGKSVPRHYILDVAADDDDVSSDAGAGRGIADVLGSLQHIIDIGSLEINYVAAVIPHLQGRFKPGENDTHQTAIRIPSRKYPDSKCSKVALASGNGGTVIFPLPLLAKAIFSAPNQQAKKFNSVLALAIFIFSL